MDLKSEGLKNQEYFNGLPVGTQEWIKEVDHEEALDINKIKDLNLTAEQETAFNEIVNRLKNATGRDIEPHSNFIFELNNLKGGAGLSEEIFQEAVKMGAVKKMSSHRAIEDFFKIQKIFTIPKEFLSSSEVTRAAEVAVQNELNGMLCDPNGAMEVKEAFHLTNETFKAIAEKSLIATLKRGFARAKEIRRLVTADFINSLEVQQAAQEGIIKDLDVNINNIPAAAIMIKENFTLSADFLTSAELQTLVEKSAAHLLKMGSINIVLDLKREFGLSDEVLTRLGQEGIRICLLNFRYEEAAMIKKALNLSDKLYKEVQEEITKK